MTKTIVIKPAGKPAANPPSPLGDLRKAFVTSDNKAATSAIAYASALAPVLGDNWWSVNLRGKGDKDDNQTAMVRGEWRALENEAKRAKHSNPAMIWKRIKEQAATLAKRAAKAEALAAHIAAGGSEDDFEGDTGGEGGKATRSPQERNVAELSKLYKSNIAALVKLPNTDDATPLSVATTHIGNALHALGERVDFITDFAKAKAAAK